jgi:glycosyltransferase involved in cell wall biosynthesis
MKVSFVIPAYNEEERLGRCLKSVLREIARYDFETEVVVVNNASTDGTKAVAESFPGVLVIDEPRKGLTAARSAGYHAGAGDLIANIDADTIMPKGWLARVFKEFSRDEHLVALSGPYIYYDLPLFSRALVKLFYIAGYIGHLFNHSLLGKGAMLQGGNFIVKRSAMELIGGYDVSFDFYGEDTDVAMRIQKEGRVKWSFGLPMYTSGRRLKEEGIVMTGVRYAVNHVWTLVFKRPYTKLFRDVR